MACRRYSSFISLSPSGTDAIGGGEGRIDMAEQRICIVAFADTEGNSLAYKKFTDVDKAVEFYKKQLLRAEVNVISTRKTIKKG